MNKIGICSMCHKTDILEVRTYKGWICNECFNEFLEYEGVDDE